MKIAVSVFALVLGLAPASAAPRPDHPNAQLIAKFYAAFDRRDGQAMQACYTGDVEFSDEVFPELKGPRAGGMWRMLCAQAKDLRVVASRIEADDTTGTAHWDATYTFTATGRKVRNSIEARFEFKDGLISRHTDSFDFWAWSKQALGFAGTALGWSPLLKYKVRKTAAKALEKFLAENPR
jgi:ketosteroid isomerase-like protein